MQVILELVFGMDEKRLTPELLERCRAAFDVFDEHLLSFPINLPGFGETTLSCTRLLIAFHAGDPAPTQGEVDDLQEECQPHVTACDAGFRKGMQARKKLAGIVKENISYIREQQSRYTCCSTHQD